MNIKYNEQNLIESLEFILEKEVTQALLKAHIPLSRICEIAVERIFVWDDLIPNNELCNASKMIIRQALRDLDTNGSFQFHLHYDNLARNKI